MDKQQIRIGHNKDHMILGEIAHRLSAIEKSIEKIDGKYEVLIQEFSFSIGKNETIDKAIRNQKSGKRMPQKNTKKPTSNPRYN